MGKKKSRASQTSKGERRNVVAGLGDDRSEMQKLNDKMDAWKRGKRVMLTIPNPIKGDKKRPFIKREAKEVWGKYTPYMMKTTY